MPPIFWLAMLLGYLVGVGGALMLLPRQIVEPLYGVLAVITIMVVTLGGGIVILTRPWRSGRPSRSSPMPPDPGRPRGFHRGQAPRSIEPTDRPELAPPAELEGGDPRAHAIWPAGTSATLGEAESRTALREGRVRVVMRPLRAWPAGAATFHQAGVTLCDHLQRPLWRVHDRAGLARAGLVARLDHMLLAHAREVLERAMAAGRRDVRVVCAIDPASLEVAGPRAELDALTAERPELARGVILLLERARMSPVARATLDRARAQGVGACVERLAVAPIDVTDLDRHGLDHVKLVAASHPIDGADPKVRAKVAALDASGMTALMDGSEEPWLAPLGTPPWVHDVRRDAA